MKRFTYASEDLFNPTIRALHDLGGSSSIQEMEDRVAQILRLSDSEISEIYRGNKTKFSHKLAWARTYLKRYGLLENSSRGVWSLTPKGRDTLSVDTATVKKGVPFQNGEDGDTDFATASEEVDDTTAEMQWQSEMLEALLAIKPDGFERLCQRLLRELGFVNVEVTGKTGDGGIDGKGVLRISGVLSFHVMFQCKRYRGTVSPSHIRDFRGALAGRADKGLFITTGSFTRDATREAQREGASPIDLIDGTELMNIMKDIGLGVKKHQIERIEVQRDWFQDI